MFTGSFIFLKTKTMQINSLDKLISPLSIEEFFNSYWEKECLVLQRDNHSFFDNLLNEADINEFLSRKDIYYPFIRVVKNGQVLPKSEYLKQPIETGFDIVDVDKVFGIYNSGGTIIIQKGQLSISKLSEFCNEVENETNFSLNANLYVTQKNTQGFEPHYDTHDIFILQIAGKKSWRLYDSFFNLPLSSQSISKADSDRYLTTTPDSEIELLPGDLIYIPRGFVHDTFTTDSTSIHITLGVFPHTRIDLLKKMFEATEMKEEFRKFLPTKFSSSEERNYFIENFKTIFKKFIDDFSLEEMLQTFEDNFLAERFANTQNRFSNSKLIDSISLETIIAVTKNISFKLSALPNDKISLKFYDKEIKFPKFIEEPLRSIIKAEKIEIKNIAGSIDDKSKIILTKKLLTEGFLSIVNGI